MKTNEEIREGIDTLLITAEAFIEQEEEAAKSAAEMESALNEKRTEIYIEEFDLLTRDDLKEKGITNAEMRRDYVRDECRKLFEDKEALRKAYGNAKAEQTAAHKNYVLTLKKIDLEMGKLQ